MQDDASFKPSGGSSHLARPYPLDVVPPAQIALLVEEVGIRKAGLAAVPMLTLGILAGAFIAFGAMF